MLLYIEVKQIREKKIKDLTSVPKREEGIINIIAITHTV